MGDPLTRSVSQVTTAGRPGFRCRSARRLFTGDPDPSRWMESDGGRGYGPGLRLVGGEGVPGAPTGHPRRGDRRGERRRGDLRGQAVRRRRFQRRGVSTRCEGRRADPEVLQRGEGLPGRLRRWQQGAALAGNHAVDAKGIRSEDTVGTRRRTICWCERARPSRCACEGLSAHPWRGAAFSPTVSRRKISS